MGTAVAHTEVRIVTHDSGFAMRLAVALRGTPFDITIVDPGQQALSEVVGHGGPPAAAIVELVGTETVVDLRDLLQRWPATRCLFVVRDMPLRSTLARIIKQQGSTTLSKQEPPIVITATLIAMMSVGMHEAP